MSNKTFYFYFICLVHKTPAEVKALEKMRKQRESLKAQRKAVQDANVKRKEDAKLAKQQRKKRRTDEGKEAIGADDEHNSGDDDDDDGDDDDDDAVFGDPDDDNDDANDEWNDE